MSNIKTTGNGGTDLYLAWRASKLAASNRAFVRGEVNLAREFQSTMKRDINSLKLLKEGKARTWQKRDIENWPENYKLQIEAALDASLNEKG